MSIGEVAERSGLSAATLRYYEDLGLVAPVARRGLTRMYDAPAIFERLEIIRLAGTIGFSLGETGVMLARANDRAGFEPLARAKLEALEQRRRDLSAATKLLRHMLVCDCGSVTDCLSAPFPSPDLSKAAARHRALRSPAVRAARRR